MSKKKLSKLLALYLPYVVIGLLATNLGEAWRLAAGKELGDKIVSLMDTLPAVFSNPLPSLHPFDLFIGLCCGAGMRLAVYLRGKNAKKYRHGMEYGSARWGGPKDIEPFMAPKFEDNIILTKTERLMMSNRPPDPKNARNKNVLVVGGSGSGKTRFFIKPNLLQCDSKNFPVSFVVTDPNGKILAAKILREAQDGMNVILAVVNQYNAVVDDIIIPTIFHALFDVIATQKTEDRDVVLLREPKDAAYYEFSVKDDLVITNKYPGFTPDEVLKSFHADTYCFDSLPEKECFFQYIKSDKVQEVYFTGMFTSNQGDLSVYYYDPESGRIRQYYPDFLAKMKDGTYQLIEVKGDNKIDDVVVQAKKEAALEMAAASGIKYEMYAGSTIMKTHVLESPPVNQTRLLP